MENDTAGQAPCREGDAVRVMAPVGLTQLCPVPLQACPAEELVEGQVGVLHRNVALQAGANQQLHEAMDIGMPLEQTPIEPANLVVLAVGIIVPPLGLSHLIPHKD